MALPNCWEIMKCGREPGGVNAGHSGVCPAFPDYGHSCWGVAGTVCGDDAPGTFAGKKWGCLDCEVFKRYERLSGICGEQLEREYPEEVRRFADLMVRRAYGNK
ncbi:MAG: two-CW domain-containing protein [Elusimicrobiota bacterium]